jgi:two-component system, NarL family, captular synthesis response regulator RcsB
MFQKVLIAEDVDSINIALNQILREMGITHIDHVKYCDDALFRVKKALADEEPYDLFITDLSFETDFREVKIKTGDEAIIKIKELQPNIQVVVYSIEDKKFRIKTLFEKSQINAYIHKGRRSIDQLKTAIQQIYTTPTIYISPELEYIFKDKTTREIDEFDMLLIKQLSNGMSQDDIETQLKTKGIVPNSRSAIEKRINKLKDYFKASNSIHLIAIAKDLGII